MADRTFFQKSASMTLAHICEISGATLGMGVDGSYVVEDVAPLDVAGAGHISFLDNIRYRAQFHQTKVAACFVVPELAAEAPEGVRVLITKTPYKAYAKTAQAFYPDVFPVAEISPAAHVASDSALGDGVRIQAGAVIGAGAQIGDGTWIEHNAVIGAGVKIGRKCRIGAGATLSHCHLGDNVRVYTGARIGQDGFGFAIDPAGHVKVPQLGRVIIHDSVEIGANTCIDRGAGPDTIIGQGTWIDNLVQIGHNVKIGRGCIIVSQVGISGSTVLEDFVAMGGQSGAAGHLRIGAGARVAAQSGIMRDIPAGEEQMGTPAMPIKQFMRQVGTLNRLIKKGKTV